MTWKRFGKEGMYRISTTGVVETCFNFQTKKVDNIWRPKALKKSKTDKYGGFYLTFRAGSEQIRLHLFMWETWKGPRTPGKVINHIDGNRENCAIDNLEEITQKENILNLIKRGGFKLFGKPHTPMEEEREEETCL